MEEVRCPRCGDATQVKSAAGMNENWEFHDREAAATAPHRIGALPANRPWEAGTGDGELRRLLAKPRYPRGFWLSSLPSTGIVIALGIWFFVSFPVAAELVSKPSTLVFPLWGFLFALGFVPTALVFRESVRARSRSVALDHWAEYRYCVKDNLVFLPGGTAASTPQEFSRTLRGNLPAAAFVVGGARLLFRVVLLNITIALFSPLGALIFFAAKHVGSTKAPEQFPPDDAAP